jgi:uncharacterized SAM-binding protein YcdF (DUF218 family)
MILLNAQRIRRRALRVLLLVAVLGGLFAARGWLARQVAQALVTEDPLAPAQALFVLAGGEVDRGREAARLLAQGYAPVAVCTGEQEHRFLRQMGIRLNEAHMTRSVMLAHGADSTRIHTLPIGTSTFEECNAILAHCQAQGWRRVLVLSSRLHTARIASVIKPRARPLGIEVCVRGAPDSRFDEDTWFRNEDGLLFVNNEYVKRLYYWYRY